MADETLTSKIWKLASYSPYDFLGFGSETTDDIEQKEQKKEAKTMEHTNANALSWPSFVGNSDHCTWGGFDEPKANDFEVRGKNYLNDKIKYKSKASLFKLANLEFYECSVSDSYHVATNRKSWYHKYNAKLPNDTFFLVYNMQLSSLNTAVVATFVIKTNQPKTQSQTELLINDDALIDEMLNDLLECESDTDEEEVEQTQTDKQKEEEEHKTIVFTEEDIESIPNIQQIVHNHGEDKDKYPWRPRLGYKPYDDSIWQKFLNADELFINQRLKIIPKIVEGSWYFTFPQRPALLGMKTPQRCYRGSNYLEIDCEADHTLIASQITKAAYHISNYLVIDIMLTIEGQDENELPERCIGGFRIKYCDTTKAKKK
eukprot:163638_1